MSSLLQFNGVTRRNRHGYGEVGLEFTRYVMDLSKTIEGSYLDPKVPCSICGKEHPQVGIAFRRPVGMLGCWVQFQYLGEIHAPDLSVPIDVPEWPKGTTVLSPEENSKLWHREDPK